MDPLMEAYLGIYEDDSWKERNFKPLSPDKKQRVTGFLNRQMIKQKDYINQADIAKDELKNPDYSKPPRVKIGTLLKKMKTGTKLMNNAQQAREKTTRREIEDKKNKLANLEGQNNIRKFQREELEYILDVLVSEGFVVDYDGAKCILEAMGDEWLNYILQEAPFDVYRGSTEYGGMKVGENEPVKINRKPYKTKKGAQRAADKENENYGAGIHRVVRIPEK
jgi:hypothetical protein